MSTPFRRLTARAAVLARDNVDTEVIIPIARLIAYRRGQLGPWCFEPWRYRPDGRLDERFELNEPRARDAAILIAGANFGCGSSREAAVWALWDMGIRCVIAESLGDIFTMNCFQNGLLPITLPAPRIAELIGRLRAAAEPTLTVDLLTESLQAPDGAAIRFGIDPERRVALLEGLDEIGMTLRLHAQIAAFEQRDAGERPWAQGRN